VNEINLKVSAPVKNAGFTEFKDIVEEKTVVLRKYLAMLISKEAST
jgi:hypothetical protein